MFKEFFTDEDDHELNLLRFELCCVRLGCIVVLRCLGVFSGVEIGFALVFEMFCLVGMKDGRKEVEVEADVWECLFEDGRC